MTRQLKQINDDDDDERNLLIIAARGRCSVGRLGHGSAIISVGWAAINLAPLIIDRPACCSLILGKISKIGFRWGSAPYPAGEAYIPAPDPLAVFKGLILRDRGRQEGERRGNGWEGKVRGKEGNRRRMEGFGLPNMFNVMPPICTAVPIIYFVSMDGVATLLTLPLKSPQCCSVITQMQWRIQVRANRVSTLTKTGDWSWLVATPSSLPRT